MLLLAMAVLLSDKIIKRNGRLVDEFCELDVMKKINSEDKIPV